MSTRRGTSLLAVLFLSGLLQTEVLTTAEVEVEHSLRVGGRTRTYLLHTPPGAPRARPLVVALHGGATNARSMARLTRLSETADREDFLVAYPNGTGRLPAVLTWNAGRCCGYASTEQVDDVGFVHAMLNDIERTTFVDRTRVFVTGISNGGQMAYRLAVEMPNRIAAIAPVAASLEVPLPDRTTPVAVVHFHGTADDHLPFEGGRGRRSVAGVSFASAAHTVQSWALNNGCAPKPTTTALSDETSDGTRVERRNYLNCRAQADVVLYLINGGGHTWPGRPVPERLLGVTTQDISATDVMWQFFEEHRRIEN